MVSCCQCEGMERQFGRKTVLRELRRLRKRGPAPTTRMLIDALRREGVADASILDIGGGVGAIYYERRSFRRTLAWEVVVYSRQPVA